MKSEVRRKLIMTKNSQTSIAGSQEVARKLSAIKNYLEDAENIE